MWKTLQNPKANLEEGVVMTITVFKVPEGEGGGTSA